ncbi:MAG: hypothetical protein AAFY44_08920, partial [Pseudomonadota bacterium]
LEQLATFGAPDRDPRGQLFEVDAVEVGFLAEDASGCRLEWLLLADESARQCPAPAKRGFLALNQE